MVSRNLLLATFAVALLRVLSPTPLLAGIGPEFQLHYFDYSCQNNSLGFEVSLELHQAGQLQTALQNGAIINLDLQASLLRTRFLLPDQDLAAESVSWQIRFDALPRDFLLLDSNGDCTRFRSLDSLLSSLLSSINLYLPIPESVAELGQCRLRIELTLHQTAVPDWLESSLFFWQWENVAPVSFQFELTPDCLFEE